MFGCKIFSVKLHELAKNFVTMYFGTKLGKEEKNCSGQPETLYDKKFCMWQ